MLAKLNCVFKRVVDIHNIDLFTLGSTKGYHYLNTIHYGNWRKRLLIMDSLNHLGSIGTGTDL
jgi:hypothetical protein